MILYALLGLGVGVVLNWAADALPRRLAVSWPRCPYCGRTFALSECSALLSGLLLRGRCAHCHSPLPWRRPLLEVASSLAFAFLWQRYASNPIHLILLSCYTSILLLVLVTDLEHRLILNTVIFPASLLALGGSLVHPGLISALAGGALAFASFYLLALLRQGGLGAGDVKLAGFIGLITGFPLAVVAIVLSTAVGGLVAGFLLLTRLKTLQSYIPYGPFLVFGGLAALFFGGQIVDWYLGLYG
ncbi:MAG: prepilin peptidase [Chloroflexi bacterium]|nr:prepilin peptidase [Chloroflexota bacterium]